VRQAAEALGVIAEVTDAFQRLVNLDRVLPGV